MKRIGRRSIPRAAAIVLSAMLLGTLAGCSASNSTSAIHSHGRTLLTYPSSGVSADAKFYGVLGQDRMGCITLGPTPILVPDGSQLLDDGSIVVSGRIYRVGTKVSFGGGFGRDPKGDPCDDKGHYAWVSPD